MRHPAGHDLLTPLLGLPELTEHLDLARTAIDEARWDRAVIKAGAALQPESRLRGAWANAAFEGVRVTLPAVRSGAAVDDSPMGRTFAAALDVAGMARGSATLLARAPWQALASLHTTAAHSFVVEAELGRPRSGFDCDDPLNLGHLAEPVVLSERLAGVGEILRTSRAPAVLVAAVVHAELAWLRPFSWGSGLVARALPRMILCQRGVDPDMLTIPEAGLLAGGRPAYVHALQGYASGEAVPLVHWVAFFSRALVAGAREVREVAAGRA